MKMPGMREVARVAGVSLSTVSVTLNDENDKYVSPENRARVMAAIDQLGYKSTQKKSQQKQVVAVIIPIITSSFFPKVLNGIEQATSAENNALLFYSTRYDFETELSYIDMLKKQNLCGIIIDTICPMDKEAEYLKLLKEEFVDKGITVVFLEKKIEDHNFYSVCVDNFKNAYTVTKYLIDKGHRLIAHITSKEMTQVSQHRLEGYKQALLDNNIEIIERLIGCGDFSPNSGYDATRALLDVRSDFTALFAANDQMAIGAIKAIKSVGMLVPRDIAVVGFDNISISSMIAPGLTTINVPTYQMGFIAAKIIFDVKKGELLQNINQLNTNLIIRTSSDEMVSSEWELYGW
jgi:LacI family transcriptional regulator/LacI family repressor for deo operon, udp, cdd, tsx, nupC, and nupG